VDVIWAVMRISKVRLRRWCKGQALFRVGAVVSNGRILAAGVDWWLGVGSFAVVKVKRRSLRGRWLGGRLLVVLSFRRRCRCG
jgi:hypothetical protein